MLKKSKEYLKTLLNGKSDIHFDRTEFWTKKIKPDANEAMLIAAYCHDIERFFNNESYLLKHKKFESGEVLDNHQKAGGEIMYNFLIKNGAEEGFTREVEDLISHHENGISDDQKVIMDADSISYLENNAIMHIKLLEKGIPKEELINKFNFMYERISSEANKQLAKPFYDNALKKLLSIV